VAQIVDTVVVAVGVGIGAAVVELFDSDVLDFRAAGFGVIAGTIGAWFGWGEGHRRRG
jgi:hypothetical protein